MQINQIQKRKLVIQTKKSPDTSGLVKKTDDSTKISEMENEIPSTTGLATSSALTAVENKIPDVGNLVIKNRL